MHERRDVRDAPKATRTCTHCRDVPSHTYVQQAITTLIVEYNSRLTRLTDG